MSPCSPHGQPRRDPFLQAMSKLNSSVHLNVTLCAPRLCFHRVTKPFFRNPFVLTSIQNPRGCRGHRHSRHNSVGSQFRDKSEVSSFAATHPKDAHLSPSAATHAKSPSRKSFPCHTSEK